MGEDGGVPRTLTWLEQVGNHCEPPNTEGARRQVEWVRAPRPRVAHAGLRAPHFEGAFLARVLRRSDRLGSHFRPCARLPTARGSGVIGQPKPSHSTWCAPAAWRSAVKGASPPKSGGGVKKATTYCSLGKRCQGSYDSREEEDVGLARHTAEASFLIWQVPPSEMPRLPAIVAAKDASALRRAASRMRRRLLWTSIYGTCRLEPGEGGDADAFDTLMEVRVPDPVDTLMEVRVPDHRRGLPSVWKRQDPQESLFELSSEERLSRIIRGKTVEFR